MPAELEDLSMACQQYEDTICGDGFADGLDLCLLGIGPDGHFASLFPDHPLQGFKGMVFAIEDSPKPPPTRLSLSLPYHLKSKRIDVLVFGEDKGKVLKQGVANPGPGVPVSQIFGHGNITFHLDEAALKGFE